MKSSPASSSSRLAFALAAGLLFAAPAARADLDLPRPSPFAKVWQVVGLTEITVDYSSPGVKGRKIWGGLVPYDQMWRAGANTATKMTFSKDVTFADKKVPAGTYAFFVIPGKSTWTVILNKKADQAGTGRDYKQGTICCASRCTRRPAPFRERLAYLVTDFTDDKASLDLEWEKLRLSIPITVETTTQSLANIKTAVDSTWRTYANAARYMLENKKDYDAGMKYVDQSLALKEDWYNLWIKAELQAAKGNSRTPAPPATTPTSWARRATTSSWRVRSRRSSPSGRRRASRPRAKRAIATTLKTINLQVAIDHWRAGAHSRVLHADLRPGQAELRAGGHGRAPSSCQAADPMACDAASEASQLFNLARARTIVLAVGDEAKSNACLESLAMAGQLSRAGMTRATPGRRNPGELRKQVEEALLPVKQETCRITLTVSPGKTDGMVVAVNGHDLTRDPTGKDGWNFEPAGSTDIRLYGSACERVQAGFTQENEIRVWQPCMRCNGPNGPIQCP